MNKDKFLKIFYWFLVLGPIIDVITSLMTRVTNFTITLGIVVRGICVVLMVIYLIVFSKSRYRKKSLIFLGSLLIFVILYFITKTDIFNPSFLVGELIYLFKYFYFPIITIGLLNLFDDASVEIKKYFKVYVIVLLSFSLLIVLANVTNSAFTTHSDLGSGNTGWFYAGNEIGAIMTILFPFMFLVVDKSNSYKSLILFIPVLYVIENIGTKTSFLGLIIPTVLVFFYYLVTIKRGNIKKFKIVLIILISIVITSPNLPVINNIKNSILMFDTHKEELEEENQTKVKYAMFSRRDLFFNDTKKIYFDSSLVDKFFGIGFTNRKSINDKKIEKLIEMDFCDIFFRYGIVGFIIYVLPLLFILRKLLIYFMINFRNNTFEELIVLYSIFIGLSVSFIAGHVLGAPAVSIYLALCLVLGMILYQNGSEIEKDKITIFALHLGSGGIEKFIHSLTEMLKNDYKIEIISTYKQFEKPFFKFDSKIKIKYLMDYSSKGIVLKQYFHERNYIKFLKTGISMIVPTIKKHFLNARAAYNCNSEYIITTRYFHNYKVGRYANDRIKKIASEHDYMLHVNKIIKSCAHMDALVLVSEDLVSFYQDRLLNTKVCFIPNVVENIMPLRLHDKNTYSIISVGRLSKEKAFDDLIEVFSLLKHKEAVLHIVGDGPEMKNLVSLSRKLKVNDNVYFHGFVSSLEISKIMKNCDLFVLTSHRESFGIVLLEAMANSLPCVAFDEAYGAKKILKHGILIKDRDKNKMAKTIDKLMDDLNKRNNLINKNYNEVLNYSLDNVSKKWNKLFKDLGD